MRDNVERDHVNRRGRPKRSAGRRTADPIRSIGCHERISRRCLKRLRKRMNPSRTMATQEHPEIRERMYHATHFRRRKRLHRWVNIEPVNVR